MLFAAIDIGTNSVLLLVAKRENDGTLRAVHDHATITRLGQGGATSRRLLPEAMERTLDALRHYAAILNRLDVAARAAIGTSALREAANRDHFLQQAEAILGCSVEVVTGQREADLVLAGVQGSFGPLASGTLIFDIGGGSTELILIRSRDDFTLLSLELGVVRLTERYLFSDPPHSEQVAALRSHLFSALRNVPATFVDVQSLIGTAGTVTTLAAVQLRLEPYDAQQVSGICLTRQELERQIARFARMPLEERKQIPGLHPARADVILAGALIVEALLRHFGAGELRVCDRGLRWGIIEELTGQA